MSTSTSIKTLYRFKIHKVIGQDQRYVDQKPTFRIQLPNGQYLIEQFGSLEAAEEEVRRLVKMIVEYMKPREQQRKSSIQSNDLSLKNKKSLENECIDIAR